MVSAFPHMGSIPYSGAWQKNPKLMWLDTVSGDVLEDVTDRKKERQTSSFLCSLFPSFESMQCIHACVYVYIFVFNISCLHVTDACTQTKS